MCAHQACARSCDVHEPSPSLSPRLRLIGLAAPEGFRAGAQQTSVPQLLPGLVSKCSRAHSSTHDLAQTRLRHSLDWILHRLSRTFPSTLSMTNLGGKGSVLQ